MSSRKWFNDKRIAHLFGADEVHDKAVEEAAKAGGFGASPSTTPIGFTGSNGSAPAAYKKCDHDGNKVEFTIDDTLTLAGARGGDVWNPPGNTTLILDFAGMVDLTVTPFVKSGPESIRALNPTFSQTKVPIARLAWPDRDAPPVEHEWWDRLLATLRKEFSPGHIIIACVGGHGRTGTALAALLLAAKSEMTVAEAVVTVREYHCKKAIESDEQVKYLMGFRPGAEHPKWLRKESKPISHTTPMSTVIGHDIPTYCAKNQQCVLLDKHKGACTNPYHGTY